MKNGENVDESKKKYSLMKTKRKKTHSESNTYMNINSLMSTNSIGRF